MITWITEVKENKKRYLDLLLLGDEDEAMIDRYLERGVLFVMRGLVEDSPSNTTALSTESALPLSREIIAVCVVTDEGGGICELKNIAVSPDRQREGCGSALISRMEEIYRAKGYKSMLVGTGEVPSVLHFYRRNRFDFSHRVPGFFTDNYPHPIVEDGITLRDMVYLKKEL